MQTEDSLQQKHQAIRDFIAAKNANNQPILLDGAMGTCLFQQGLQSGDAPELWNIDQPERIKTIYRDYFKSGSDIILTNSFGGSAARLKLHQLESRVHELNEATATLANDVRAELYDDGTFAKTDVKLIAGSVGPSGELLQPMGPMSKPEAEELFYEQICGLKAGGADLVWIETMSLLDEADAAYQAALRAEIPAAITLSFDMNGKTMMGVTEQQFCDYANSDVLALPPVAIGFNCGLGFSDSLLTLAGLIKHAKNIPVIAKSNCGLPSFNDGEIQFDGTPELMRDYAVMARNGGASVIGGCCGSSAEHVAQMRDALASNEKQDIPLMRDAIEQKFGAAGAPDNESVARIEQRIAERGGRRGARRNRD
ncbi:MAG: betaine--homocysteine S-methyltransferase [Alphaproteobacteria bacterium]|nr:betaine--homocysteine S-methyltransferase [Alphaproteobacteria bacterium]